MLKWGPLEFVPRMCRAFVHLATSVQIAKRAEFMSSKIILLVKRCWDPPPPPGAFLVLFLRLFYANKPKLRLFIKTLEIRAKNSYW